MSIGGRFYNGLDIEALNARDVFGIAQVCVCVCLYFFSLPVSAFSRFYPFTLLRSIFDLLNPIVNHR
jgi:hypothetical protein